MIGFLNNKDNNKDNNNKDNNNKDNNNNNNSGRNIPLKARVSQLTGGLTFTSLKTEVIDPSVRLIVTYGQYIVP